MLRILFFLLAISHVSFGQINSGKDLLKTDTSINLFAFVAQKISLNEFDPNARFKEPLSVEFDSTSGDTLVRRRAYVMDNAFDAKYKVLKSVFNNLETDTVEFKVYDHYGRPAFEKYSTVLLYISKSEDGNYFFHQKYQFDPLYKSKDGSWVGKNGESLQKLFNDKKSDLFKNRGIF